MGRSTIVRFAGRLARRSAPACVILLLASAAGAELPAGGESARRVRARLEKGGAMDALHNQVVEHKVVDIAVASHQGLAGQRAFEFNPLVAVGQPLF